jgi:hypothetical protein
MYLTKYQNLRIGFQAYFKNIPRKSYPPLKSKKIFFQAKKKVRGLERHPDIYPFLLIS